MMAPTPLLYVPAAHAAHAMMAPTPLLYVPAGHPMQAVAVPDGRYWPAVQLGVLAMQEDPDWI